MLWPDQDDQLSDFMHQLSCTHVHRWHKAHDSRGQGHVYQGRFKSFPIQDDSPFYTVCRYVERNPIAAGLVERAEDWVWGSAWGDPHAADRRTLLLSQWPVARPNDWLKRVNQPLTHAEIEALRCCVDRGGPYGRESWVAHATATLHLEHTQHPRGRPPKSR